MSSFLLRGGNINVCACYFFATAAAPLCTRKKNRAVAATDDSCFLPILGVLLMGISRLLSPHFFFLFSPI